MGSNGTSPAVIDLAEVAAAHPPRVVRLSAELLANLDSYIGHGGVMLLARTLNRRLDQLRQFDPKDPETFAILPAIAWVILRRAEPHLTLDDCWTFSYEVTAPPEVAPAPLDPPLRASSAPGRP